MEVINQQTSQGYHLVRIKKDSWRSWSCFRFSHSRCVWIWLRCIKARWEKATPSHLGCRHGKHGMPDLSFQPAEVNMMNNKRPGCENLHVLSLNVCFDRMLQGFLWSDWCACTPMRSRMSTRLPFISCPTVCSSSLRKLWKCEVTICWNHWVRMIAIHHICTYNMYIIPNIHIICTYVYKCAYIYICMHTIVHIHISLVFQNRFKVLLYRYLE